MTSISTTQETSQPQHSSDSISKYTPVPLTQLSPSDCLMETDGFQHVAQRKAKRKGEKTQKCEKNIQSPPQKMKNGPKETKEENWTYITWSPKCAMVENGVKRHRSAKLESPHHNHPWRFRSISMELYNELKDLHPNKIKRQDKLRNLDVARLRVRLLSGPEEFEQELGPSLVQLVSMSKSL